MGEEVVYVLQGGPYCKIGRSKDVSKRLKEFQTSHPYRLVILRTWETDTAALLERYLHRRFQLFKLSGEWFQFPSDELDRLVGTEAWSIEPFERPVRDRRPVRQVKPAPHGSLRQLIESRTDIRTPGGLRENITDMSRQQAWLLWHGKTTLGLRTAKRIAEATKIPLEDLAEVAEAVPGRPRGRTPRVSKRHEASC